ncbi:MAG TPA: hypothetical protein EYP16_01045 [Candidatus Atribacteria bacterium]|nr:hypothetical protein [Candidatus Atribacteria bacterium]
MVFLVVLFGCTGLNVKRFTAFFSAFLGLTGIYLIALIDNRLRLELNLKGPSEAYYIGLALLFISVAIYLAPVIFPPKRYIPTPSYTLKCPFCFNSLKLINGVYKCKSCDYVIDSSPILVSMRDLASLVDLALLNCSSNCKYVAPFSGCSALIRYANLFNAELPSNCPVRLKGLSKNEKKI